MVLLPLVLLLTETIDDPFGIRMVVPAAGVLVSFGFRLFLGSRLPSTVIVMESGLAIPSPDPDDSGGSRSPTQVGNQPGKNISQISNRSAKNPLPVQPKFRLCFLIFRHLSG